MENQGQFVWFDINTPDPAKAQAFYTALFDWKIDIWPSEKGDYAMMKANEKPFGGFGPLPSEEIPPHWLAHISTDAVDAKVEEIVAKGGAIHMPPMDIPKIGRFAVVADPQGAVFSVFQSQESPEGDMPEEGPAKMGEIGWHELMTKDVDAATSFYKEIFGWTDWQKHSMGEMDYHHFKTGTHQGGGMMVVPKEAGEAPPNWLYYVQVEDVAATGEKAVELGGKIVHGPVEIPMGKFVIMMDNQGAAFAAWQAKDKPC